MMVYKEELKCFYVCIFENKMVLIIYIYLCLKFRLIFYSKVLYDNL